MTTVTVVTGDPRSGKMLVGAALAEYINKGDLTTAVTVEKHTPLYADSVPAPEDLILISTTTKSEKWMLPWFKRYGDPMFHVHIKRLQP
jgi:hypothetical protein